ncbi:MAG: hypothetical protein H6730_17390 [Deltaproteobacteria bacterium]|nr:hypothetical protein [Deltaproteobacteria bacterium]
MAGLERLAQLAVGEALLAEEEPLLVRVPGVVQEQLHPGAAVRGDLGLEVPDGGEEPGAIGILEPGLVRERHPAEIVQHPRDRLGVLARVAQHRAIRPAVAGGGEDRVAVHGGGRPRWRGRRRGRGE